MAKPAREPDLKEKLEAQAEAAGDTVARPGGSSGGAMPSTGTLGGLGSVGTPSGGSAGASAGAQPDGTSGMSGAPTNDAQPRVEKGEPNAEEYDPRAPG